jgi:hypothetical protein
VSSEQGRMNPRRDHVSDRMRCRSTHHSDCRIRAGTHASRGARTRSGVQGEAAPRAPRLTTRIRAGPLPRMAHGTSIVKERLPADGIRVTRS